MTLSTPPAEERNRTILGPYRRLEAELWREVRALRPGPLSPLTVVAPTGRLVRRLKREAAVAFPDGLLGVRHSGRRFRRHVDGIHAR